MIDWPVDLDGNGNISLEEFSEWFMHKGGKGDILRQRLKSWYKQLSSASTDDMQSMTVSIGFDKGKALLGTKRVEGKITYFFSHISGVSPLLAPSCLDQSSAGVSSNHMLGPIRRRNVLDVF